MRGAVICLLLVAACGGGGTSAETCDEVADETIELAQSLIDELERELGDRPLAQILASGVDGLRASTPIGEFIVGGIRAGTL